MATKRLQANLEVSQREPRSITYEGKVSELFGQNVFHAEAMREYLPSEAYKLVLETIETGARLDRKVADQVASAMKDWALTKGATHYTHWFQPLTGTTAEKHDAFFKPVGVGKAIERFDGDLLVQQEPDASSFPNGGIRNTFEARGYTAWDPSSPAFVIGKTLCIPCVFLSYTGESLDYKMPLLKALNAIDKAAIDVCQYFDKNVTKVNATLGWEQEYFLIDQAHYNARPDLMMTGRALFGQTSAKGQQLDDHYFGSIPARATAFMREFETEAVKLGIPVTTRHNEVAPNQFECAPIFEECNLANDHNQLLMDLMEKVARKHNFRVLLHEKPFAGLNGSGKHNNWSLSTNTGVNLLAPGKNPKSNLQFLTFFVNTIKAIHDNADLLRASIASATNDYRLGANEAPPAIISAFIGTYLSNLLDELEKNIKAGKMTPEAKTELKLNIGKIPQILLDNTDRNRTSPFAFTGNKFEFRAVGSSANCAQAMFVLNTIVAKQLKEFKIAVDTRIDKGDGKDEAILKELQKLIKESKKIRFEGNGYGEEWVKEAAKRGLSNHKDTPSALQVWSAKSVVDLFEEMDVLTKRELLARQEIEFENYVMKVQIESRIMNELSQNHILPATVEYQNKLLQNVRELKALLGDQAGAVAAAAQIKIIDKIALHLNQLISLNYDMLEARKVANKIEDYHKKAFAYCETVKVYFEQIRYHADKLEWLVEDELWPLPKFREMLFTK
ncbi:glutamine synthetase III [Crocinitomicaceae bacterium CZZ-1]|uniref:Glutamine synthetase III n=1 Tax=Taishania pollutisoli TaxID=2766479 RepID=A0A8J6TZX1_9FLAO|nr:glutamine synthetase III [Taishania pollutisoli]MBC9812743.1 glutamine synthetase III [Taishania pollutisoli]MBX2949101.1 glutamine synthetase III [Crocinitomicaceae bacterium]NGF75969.1 glutamine synthetase type III [Fluviicola sp. SGL-29]